MHIGVEWDLLIYVLPIETYIQCLKSIDFIRMRKNKLILKYKTINLEAAFVVNTQ